MAEDHLAGAFLGLALGDALGFVVEAAPPEVASSYVQDWLLAGRAGERAHPGFPFGQYSDDTQLARALLLGMRDAGGWDPAAFACRIAELFREGRDIGAGPGTRAAALRLIAGTGWEHAGTPPPYAGNGSAMRVAPLGVLFATDLDRLRSAAAAQSRVTHQDPRCAGASVAVAGAVALAIRPGPLDPRAFLAELADLVALESAEVAAMVRGLDGVGQSPATGGRGPPARQPPGSRVRGSMAGHLGLRSAERGVDALRVSPLAGRLLGDSVHRDRGGRRHRYDGGHGRRNWRCACRRARLAGGALGAVE